MLRRLVAASLVAAAVPAVALAADPAFDVWQGAAGKKASVSIVRQVGKKSTMASVSFQCTDGGGVVHSYTTELSGKSKGRALHLKGPALNGSGTARLDAKLKRKRAKGSFAVSLPQAEEGSDVCEASHTFSLKGRRATGG